MPDPKSINAIAALLLRTRLGEVNGTVLLRGYVGPRMRAGNVLAVLAPAPSRRVHQASVCACVTAAV